MREEDGAESDKCARREATTTGRGGGTGEEDRAASSSNRAMMGTTSPSPPVVTTSSLHPVVPAATLAATLPLSPLLLPVRPPVSSCRPPGPPRAFPSPYPFTATTKGISGIKMVKTPQCDISSTRQRTE
ncbi:Os09g0555950 [Oryza sativa Japonica Group]|uniref:Os09g0555950 protein n=1 Tax=Oryza sativa subsp. japonica TaxID=39947 RepID=A0A0P0XR89_ORYSJ|nr:Os09g0555950 [Oryza sativa Japonica Group]